MLDKLKKRVEDEPNLEGSPLKILGFKKCLWFWLISVACPFRAARAAAACMRSSIIKVIDDFNKKPNQIHMEIGEMFEIDHKPYAISLIDMKVDDQGNRHYTAEFLPLIMPDIDKNAYSTTKSEITCGRG